MEMSVPLLRTFLFMYRTISLLLFFFSFNAFSSRAQLVDSIVHSFTHKPSLYWNYGTNYSFISNQFAGIMNIKLGADFNTTTKIGLGFNWIQKGMEKQIPVDGYLHSQLYMRYVSVFFEYTYFKTYHWEASIPAQIGLGNMNYLHTLNNGTTEKSENKWFVLYEPITTIQYRFLKYFAVGGGIGFRLVIPNKPTTFDHFASVLFVVKSKFYFTDAFRDFKKWVSKD
jgi:hypothetical protein